MLSPPSWTWCGELVRRFRVNIMVVVVVVVVVVAGTSNARVKRHTRNNKKWRNGFSSSSSCVVPEMQGGSRWQKGAGNNES
jgi:hypothetical protein